MALRLLEEFASDDISEFRLDFKRLIEMTIELDKEYGAAEDELLYNLPIYKNFVSIFNKKYPGLCCHFEERNEGFALRLMFRNEMSVREAFEAAEKIDGMSAVSTGSVESVSRHNTSQFEIEKRRIGEKVNVFYSGEESIFLKYSQKHRMVELVYKPDSIMKKKNSPGFIICVYYALRSGFKSGINLADIAGKFSSTATGASRLSFRMNK